MTPKPFSELEFRYFVIETDKGMIKGIFSDLRLDTGTVPDGLIPYSIRHTDDDWGEPATIEKSVFVNYFGVLLVNEPLDFGASDYIEIPDWGYGDREDAPDWAQKYLTC